MVPHETIPEHVIHDIVLCDQNMPYLIFVENATNSYLNSFHEIMDDVCTNQSSLKLKYMFWVMLS